MFPCVCQMGLWAKCATLYYFEWLFDMNIFSIYLGTGIESRVLHMLGKHSTTWAMPPVLLLSFCFWDRVSITSWTGPELTILLPPPPGSWDYGCEPPHPALFLFLNVGNKFRIKNKNSQALVAHTCNPSYSGGRDQEDYGSKPTRANSSQDPISKKQ
jgi:hypothetical protein